MNYTSQKTTFQTYTNGTSPRIGADGYWYIGDTNTKIKAEGADALTMLLSNDSDIIVRNNLGAIVGELPTTEVFVLQGATEVAKATITPTPPTDFEKNGGKYTFTNNKLTINELPEGFTAGTFTFTHSGISKTFSLKVVSSEVDYDLIIDKTLINTTNVPETGGSVTITVKKTDSNDTSILTANSNEAQLKIGGSTNPASSWIIPYEQGDTTAIPVVLEVKVGDAWIEWDKETIEFVANGEDSVAYWLAASSPIIAKTANGEYSTTSITFTPMIQIGNGTPKVANYDDDKVKLAIWKDNQSVPVQGTLSGAQTVTLVNSGQEDSSQNKLAVSEALYCRMFLYSNNNCIKVDEQTVEVLADGVTISDVEYGTSDSYSTEPTNFGKNYPTSITPGQWIWTRTYYSNGVTANLKTYYSQDNITASLTNDYDLVVKNNAGVLVSSFPITSTIELYQGSQKLTPTTCSWSGPNGFTGAGATLDLTAAVYKNKGPGSYVGTAEYNETTYTKTFTIAETTAEVDYSLIVPSTVNISNGAKDIAVQVLKVGKGYDGDSSGTATLSSSGSHPIEIYTSTNNGTSWTKQTSWSGISISQETQIRLISTWSGGPVWDEETIEVVTDGATGRIKVLKSTIANTQTWLQSQVKDNNPSWPIQEGEPFDSINIDDVVHIIAKNTTKNASCYFEGIVYGIHPKSASQPYDMLDLHVKLLVDQGEPGTKGDAGKTAGTITLYKLSNDIDSTTKQPKPPSITGIGGTSLAGWSTDVQNPIGTARFLWKINGTYTEDEGGKNREYGTSWTTPELHSAHYAASNVSGSTAAEYYKLFGTDEDNQGMKFNNSGQLYINASMINAGTLTITKGGTDGDKTDVLFSAGWGSDKVGSVKIGQWQVVKDSIFAETKASATTEQKTPENIDELGSVGMYCGDDWTAESLLPGGGYSPVRFYAGLKKNNNGDGTVTITTNFLVLEDGSAYMTAGKIGDKSVISNKNGEYINFTTLIDKHNSLNDQAAYLYNVTYGGDIKYEQAKIDFNENIEAITIDAEERE